AVRAAAARHVGDSGRGFRLLYLGRWHPVKGIDVLVRAVRAIPPEIPVTLTIHGVGEGIEERAYAAAISRLVGSDPRIAIKQPIPRHCLASTLAEASALAVPSLWFETGPMVVLEAKAAGLPVIGSRLGGIRELVREPEDGILLPPGDTSAWAAAIATISLQPARHRRLSRLTQVRTMRDAAIEIAELYTALSPTKPRN